MFGHLPGLFGYKLLVRRITMNVLSSLPEPQNTLRNRTCFRRPHKLKSFDVYYPVEHATRSCAVERQAPLSSWARGTGCRKGSHTSFRGIRYLAQCPGTSYSFGVQKRRSQ